MKLVYKHYDATAIYNRGIINGTKNWRMAWAIRQARKHKPTN